MYFSTAVLLTVLPAILAQTPPGFTPSSDTPLVVTFNTTVAFPPGQELGINVPAAQPTLSLPSATVALVSNINTFLFTIVDPDAHTPQNPDVAQFLHWLQPNVTLDSNGTLDTSAAAIVPFVRPTPPNDSVAHRYVCLLFAQPDNFSVPADFSGFSAANRTLFNITIFAAQAGLGSPVAADFFLVSNLTGVANLSGPSGVGAPVATSTPIQFSSAVKAGVGAGALGLAFLGMALGL